MKKSFAIIGLGRFGMAIIKSLEELNCDYLAIDCNEDSIKKASEICCNANCVVCDSTKKSSLKDSGVGNVDHAIIAIGNNLQATILTLINVKELGVKHITVRIDDEEYETIMMRLGADDVIVPEEASATTFAHQIVSDTFIDYYEVMQGYAMIQMKISEKFQSISLIELDSRNKFDVNIVGIIRDSHFFIPKGTDLVEPEDILLVMGKDAKINRFDAYMNK